MSGSYGGGGGGDWQRRPERQKNQQPELRVTDDTEGSDPEDGLDSQEPSLLRADIAPPPVPMDFGKRLVAGIIDLTAAYLIGMVVALIPWINEVVAVQLVMVLILLVRDDFYGGRGIGKNVMGLQVVDADSGEPCTMLQSFKRNIVILIAPLILYIISGVVTLLHMFGVSDSIEAVGQALPIINTIGLIYIVIVIPAEAYRAYKRADGRRFGDQLAGTKVVSAAMDFSNPFASR